MATIASLGAMTPPYNPSGTSGTSGTAGTFGGGTLGGSGTAQSGLSQINNGSQTVEQSLATAANALGSGQGSGAMQATPSIEFKKGGKVSSKGRDWHGFGSSKTGKHNHGF